MERRVKAEKVVTIVTPPNSERSRPLRSRKKSTRYDGDYFLEEEEGGGEATAVPKAEEGDEDYRKGDEALFPFEGQEDEEDARGRTREKRKEKKRSITTPAESTTVTLADPDPGTNTKTARVEWRGRKRSLSLSR